MYRRPRIIPSLLLQDGGLVKTQKFDKPRYLGDPVNAVKIFNNKGVDELCILDISAPRTGGEPDYDLLHDIATEAFMPLSYGGGVHSLEQIQRLFAIGYEKVILNTALVETPDLIREAVAYAGSQSIVASIDVKTDVLGRSFCYIRGGREKTSFSPIKLAQTAQALGAGEILLTSMDCDGTKAGYDLELTRAVADAVSIPVIASGGAGKLEHFKEALTVGGADAALAASLFHYKELEIREVKEYLRGEGIPVRL